MYPPHSPMDERPRLRVRTASSTYLVDLDEGWVARQPGHGAALLRRDAQRLCLLGLARPICLGEPMYLVLAGLAGPGTITFRRSTPVVEVAPVPRPRHRNAGMP